MPDTNTPHEDSTETIKGVPLCLVPKIIADQFVRKRDTVFQIAIDREFYRCFTVIVKTRDECILKVRRKGPGRPDGDRHG